MTVPTSRHKAVHLFSVLVLLFSSLRYSCTAPCGTPVQLPEVLLYSSLWYSCSAPCGAPVQLPEVLLYSSLRYSCTAPCGAPVQLPVVLLFSSLRCSSAADLQAATVLFHNSILSICLVLFTTSLHSYIAVVVY